MKLEGIFVNDNFYGKLIKMSSQRVSDHFPRIVYKKYVYEINYFKNRVHYHLFCCDCICEYAE